jgi:hypothetical protein
MSAGTDSIVADQAFGEVTIRFEPPGNVAGADAIERAFEHKNLGGFEHKADVRSQRHFASVADQAEAGDVGESVDGPRRDSRPRLSCRSFAPLGTGGTPVPT